MEAEATPVTVKWGTQTFELQVEPRESVEDFRHKLFSLTNVPPDRQKIMVSEDKRVPHLPWHPHRVGAPSGEVFLSFAFFSPLSV